MLRSSRDDHHDLRTMVMVQKRKKGKKNGLKTAPRIRAGKAPERKDGVVVVVRGLNKKKSIAASGTFPSLIAQRESRETEERRWPQKPQIGLLSIQSFFVELFDVAMGDKNATLERERSHKKHRLESLLFSFEWPSLLRQSVLQLIPLFPLPAFLSLPPSLSPSLARPPPQLFSRRQP